MKIRRFLIASLLLHSSLFAESLRLKIDAGDFPRSACPVTIDDPGNLPDSPAFKDSEGKITPLQKSNDGKFIFILTGLDAGKTVVFEVIDSPQESIAIAETNGENINFHISGKPVTTYRGGAPSIPNDSIDPLYKRSGYLHPVLTPTGQVVTDDFPKGHLHHHGIWMAWTKTEFQNRQPDFWNMGQGKGRVDFKSLEKTWSGPVHTGLVAHHQYVDLTGDQPVTVLDEKFSVQVFAASEKYHLFDLESSQTLSGEDRLKLPVYHYGGLGVRGLAEWNGKDNARFLTSENLTDRVNANSKPARWFHIGGDVKTGSAGFAVLCHPDNFRSPQPIRIHPEEPFVSFAPQTNGEMAIEKDETYRSRYRFVVADGNPEKDLLNRLWNDYANPPKATWIK